MKTKITVFVVLLMIAVMTAVRAETYFEHDFTFGLSDDFNAVKSVTDDDNGHDTFERFLQVRGELPDEIPIFQPYEAKAKCEIYIAKDGNDSNPGTKDKPLKSFDVAFEKIASSDRDGGVILYIREGIYDISEGLELTERLSGSEKNKVIISAYPGESVKLTGGINIKGSEFKVANDEVAMSKLPDSAKGKVYSVNLKDLGYNDYPVLKKVGAPVLKVDGTEYTIARWPNASKVKMAKYEGADGKNGVIDIGPVTDGLGGNTVTGDTGTGFEFQVLDPRPFTWENTDDIWMFGSFGVEYLANYQHIRSFNEEKQSIRTYTHESYGAGYNTHHSYYYLNILEELDIPGEWYLDRMSGILYLYPIYDLSESTISIPVSSKDLIHFTSGTEHIVLNDVTVCDTTGCGIVVDGYRNIVQNCTVTGVASIATKMLYAKNCGVINSKLYGNVKIDQNLNHNRSVSNDSANLRPTRNFIQNNYVIGGNIEVRYGVQQIISHNTVMNCPSMCIYVAQTQESIIEYNDVVGGPWRTIDGGMVYHEGAVDNIYNHIRYNYCHDSTVDIRSYPFGIYLDDLSCNAFVYGNRVQQGSIFMHGGSRNVAYNNVVIDENATSPSIYNSDNYIKGEGGMRRAFKSGWISASGHRMAWDNSGMYKAGQMTWKNRYPTVYAWIQGLQKVRKDALDPNYKQSDSEKDWLRPQENVYKNNVIYNSKGVAVNTSYEKRSWWDNNYQVPEGDEIFEDYENRIYNIRSDSDVFEAIDDFEQIPPIEKMGVIGLHDKISIGDIYPIFPINDENQRVFPSDISFKWTNSPVATYYILEISKDKEFTDLIGTYKTKENFYIFDDEFDLDTIYYWRVTALCYGVSVENVQTTMDTASFKTYTYAQAAANTTLDTSVFNEEYEYIKTFADSITEDSKTDIGIATYKEGTKEKLREFAEAAKKRVEGYALQREVQKELDNMKKGFIDILHENAISYARHYSSDDLSMWSIDPTKGTVKPDNGGVTVKSLSSSSVIAHDNRLLAPGEAVSVKMNFGDNKGWDAFGIKQIEVKEKNIVTSAKGYYIIVKQDMIELQKYPAVGSAIITEVVNGGNIIKPNTYHDIEVSCSPEGDNAHIIFKVDGTEIINYIDETDPIMDLGYFSIQAFNGGISVK